MFSKHRLPSSGDQSKALSPNSEAGILQKKQAFVAQTILVCGFTGHSCPVFLKLATGKSPEPAGWKTWRYDLLSSLNFEFGLSLKFASC
jgi:hypothetical protein